MEKKTAGIDRSLGRIKAEPESLVTVRLNQN
jgi:hypothetical protein